MFPGAGRLGGAFSREEVKNEGDDNKNEKEMDEKSGYVIENEAADPDDEEDDSEGEPSKAAHEVLL